MSNKDNTLQRIENTSCRIWSVFVMIGAISLLITGIVTLVDKDDVGFCENTSGQEYCDDKDKNECIENSSCTWRKSSNSADNIAGSLYIVFSVLLSIFSIYLWKMKNPGDFLGGICFLGSIRSVF